MNIHLYDAIILLGVNGGAADFCLELMATDVPAEGHEKEPGGKLITTVNLSNPSWFNNQHLYSFDAGTYYCNQLYYMVLNIVYSRRQVRDDHILPVMFIHVPPFEAVPVSVGLEKLNEIIIAIMQDL